MSNENERAWPAFADREAAEAVPDADPDVVSIHDAEAAADYLIRDAAGTCDLCADPGPVERCGECGRGVCRECIGDAAGDRPRCWTCDPDTDPMEGA